MPIIGASDKLCAAHIYGTIQLKSSRWLTHYHGVAVATTWSTSEAKPLLSCVDLFACLMEIFNNSVIFIQGSGLYGHLDFTNVIFFVRIVFGQRQT